MYRIESFKKRDPYLRWALPDRAFFACGACHILAYAFLELHQVRSLRAIWLNPDAGYTGNHIYVASSDWVFDYHGYSDPERYHAHTWRKAQRWWPGWNATPVELPMDVLVSEAKSKTYDGLWFRKPTQFLHDALPRAHAYLTRFSSPPRPKALMCESACYRDPPFIRGLPQDWGS